MRKLILLIFCCYLFACSESPSTNNTSSKVVNDTIRASSNYLSKDPNCPDVDNKYFSLQGVPVSNYYSIFDSLIIDLNNDGKEDYLYVLSPISLDSHIDCEKPLGTRELVELINKDGYFTVRNRYSGLISNIGGVMSKYSGMNLIEKGFEIIHESGSRYTWTYTTLFTTKSADSIYLDKIVRTCSFEGQEESTEFFFKKKSINHFNINDSIKVNCNCDSVWNKLDS